MKRTSVSAALILVTSLAITIMFNDESGDIKSVAASIENSVGMAEEGWEEIKPQLPFEFSEVILETGESGEEYGLGISVSIDDDVVVVGAIGAGPEEEAPILQTGAAFVFYRNQGGPNNWGKVAKLIASDAQEADLFGLSVAIDGDTIVVGATNEDGGTGDPMDAAGAAYIFERNHGGEDNWGEVKKITASDSQEGDWFGLNLDINGDTLIVGAHWEDGGIGDPTRNAGAAYIFERNYGGQNNWGEIKKITASDAQASDQFSWTLAISGDTVAVGASAEDGGSGDPMRDVGAVYVFERNFGGVNNWGEVKKLLHSDAEPGDGLGLGLSISGDTIAGGAGGEDGGPGSPILASGAVYIFERNEGGTNNWGEVAKLTANDSQENDAIGIIVSISGDRVAAGAIGESCGPVDPVTLTGAVYIYERNEGGANNWGQEAKLNASNAEEYDAFGWPVAISENTVVVGVGSALLNAPINGKAYVYYEQEGTAMDNVLYLPFTINKD